MKVTFVYYTQANQKDKAKQPGFPCEPQAHSVIYEFHLCFS